MTVETKAPLTPRARIGDSALAAKLRREIEGEVLFDAFSRGRYSTDASIYQVEPIGVVIPRTDQDIVRAIEIAVDEGIPILPRGGGTSQCGQTVNEALVVDTSKYLRDIVELDPEARRAVVQPGLVLDQLNAAVKSHGLFFPVDVSTSSRATIGGMTANNSCGSRSIRYGNMMHNVLGIDTMLADGAEMRFGPVSSNLGDLAEGRYLDLVRAVRGLADREREEIAARFPDLLRRVGGYNIDTVRPEGHNMAHLLVGSEGTLGFFKRVEIQLHRIPPQKVLGVCHFPTFYQAMATTKHIVGLDPDAVELIDRTMINLSREIAAFRPIVERFVKGDPEAVLIVEFAGEDLETQKRRLKELGELMADHGFPDAVVEAVDPDFQRDIIEVRKAGLNIMMSMKGDGKPVSFIEDCAVPLDDLAEYTDRLTRVFEKHDTVGTWYAHASVGCLHVRPILNMKAEQGAKTMRAVAEEAFAMVREYKGSHSGEHGDGIVRSEFHDDMFGDRIVAAFGEVKRAFDPGVVFNPGRVVDPPKMDDRTLFRYKPGYAPVKLDAALDWSGWGGFDRAIEMCNNNGECRKFDTAVMCPSFRATRDEKDVTRGRANTLRLAITGQLGPDAFTSDAMAETMDLCVGCKGCKRECPTGVDMARMKIEFQHHYAKRHGLKLRDRIFAYLPRYARWAAPLSHLMNLRDALPGLPWLSEKALGLSARRSLPRWPGRRFDPAPTENDGTSAGEVVLFADTFNTWFEPENAEAAKAVLEAAGYTVHIPRAPDGGRPLCCGRTFLSSGLVDQARREATRLLAAFRPYIERGIPVVGLEPSCLLALRDELTAMSLGPVADTLAERAMLFEEFLAAEKKAGRLALDLKPVRWKKALLHGHCHQKAFGAMGAVHSVLAMVPGLDVKTIPSSCCGMAGSFGYEAEHYDVSLQMAEASLLPAVRAADADTAIVADGTSCRHQIHDGAGRDAVHVARILHEALAG